MNTLPPGFAILDLETTGLRPKSDRVVEIAIVRTDARGNPLAELSTLINPERAVGATSIHGITNADVREAPPFREVAGHVVELLRGATIVAHNLPFDFRFLTRELERLGVAPFEMVGVCTLQESVRWLQPLYGRSLTACCDRIGLRFEQQHHALGDARATVRVLGAIGREMHSQGITPFAHRLDAGAQVAWPSLPGRASLVSRDLASYRHANRRSHVAALVDRPPTTASSGIQAEGYLLALDEALEDRTVTDEEGAGLLELASELGIGSGDLPRLHFAYLRDLACVAVADGIVSDEERADLENVARLLGFPITAVPAALDAATRNGAALALAERRPLAAGMKVCFSDTRTPKPELEGLARAFGLEVRTQVSKKTDLVVTADPLSQSAKLEKARSLGVRILIETVFLGMMHPTAKAARSGTAPPMSAQLATGTATTSWAPGWYADPSGAPAFRYWDGRAWTAHVTGSRVPG